MKKTVCIVIAALLLPFLAFAQAPKGPYVPPSLTEWREWVLHKHETEIMCTPAYNNSSQMFCAWPSALKLELNDTGGTFEQTWELNRNQYIPLPGNSLHWPEDVTVNGERTTTVPHKTGPALFASKGSHLISGRFSWHDFPEYLQIPSQSALIELSINGQKSNPADRNQNGRLWLKSPETKEAKDEDRINLNVFRRINDTIPPLIDIHLELQVSGSPREIDLGQVFPAESFLPVSISSSLPARIEQNGSLRMQVKPGNWSASLTIRNTKELQTLSFRFPQGGHWPASEVWVFQSQPSLRVVKIEGVPPIDPNQTTLPPSWKNLPAYFIRSGDNMRFTEIKRGDPDPVPDKLSLTRNIWLRFDGSGYTLSDKITGEKNNDWRFEAKSGLLQLGRVTIDGQEQFITTNREHGPPGVEMRKGLVNMEIDSTIEAPAASIPAHGYNTTFHNLTSTLHLPPGYRVLSVSNADNAYPTWLRKWDLLNLFILLITTISAVKLFGPKIGLLTFTTLVLLFHEPADPPLYSWLNLFAALALLKVVPEGKIRRMVTIYKWFVLGGIILISIPFMVSQVRTAVYPQLEKGMFYPASIQKMAPAAQQAGQLQQDDVLYETESKASAPRSIEALSSAQEGQAYNYRKQAAILDQDPESITQTGPGLPNWSWNRVQINWTGPVDADHEIGLILVPPKINLVLGFVKCILLVLLFLSVCGLQLKKGNGPGLSRFMSAVILIATTLFILSPPKKAGAADFPTPEMLSELERRLLESDPCFENNCADFTKMTITAEKDSLLFLLDINTELTTAVPLPGYLQQWLPETVKASQGADKRTPPLLRHDGTLWVLLPKGIHQITIAAKVPPSQSSLQISTSINPHKVSAVLDGWLLEGIDKNGKMDGIINLKRVQRETGEQAKSETFDTGTLPPFFQIERTLRLGLNWEGLTVVRRIGPPGPSETLRIPLIPGESVTSEGTKVEAGLVVVNFNPAATTFYWNSIIEKSTEIQLLHAETSLWTETYKVEPSQIWHLEYEGPPVIHHKEGDRWFPQWHLWPGEKIKLTITKPFGIEGKTRTITSSHLEVRPGKLSTDNSLSFQLRSSQGGQHSVHLPAGATIQKLEINKKPFPFQQDAGSLIIPINPGNQDVLLEWRDQTGIKTSYRTPVLDLGTESVNANITVHLNPNRWPLFLKGPQMGPAVLYWSVLIVILVVSFGLARMSVVPLKMHQWFLLCVGLSQTQIGAAALVVFWLLALGLRKKADPDMPKGTFNFMQLCLALLTFLSLSTLVAAISKGLLGSPDMWISGNSSSNYLLNWYADRTSTFPRGHIISVPLYIYRVLMLAWALWISFSLLRLLRWGWDCFSNGHLWHKVELKLPKKGTKE